MRLNSPSVEGVLLLSGEATLTVAVERVQIRAGDHLFLPAHTPHTVEQTSAGATWLAVNLHPDRYPNQHSDQHTDPAA